MERCPACDGREFHEFATYPNFSLIRCSGCNLVMQRHAESAPVELLVAQTYNLDWVAMRDRYAENTFREHALFGAMLLDMFWRNKGRLLEIGSGTGEFLYLAKQAGWDVTGIEPAALSCEYAKQRHGLDLITAIWDPALLEGQYPFDAIVFSHVFEHIPNPEDFLRQLKPFLTEEGKILLSVPNKNSFTNSIYGTDSPLFVEADHLFHYSEYNLELLLRRSGFEVVSLFSREEPNRLENDLNAKRQRLGAPHSLTAKEKAELTVKLQSNFNGHELFCIAKPAANHSA